MATRDIAGFSNRFPAGETLKHFQFFQDPRIYGKTKAENVDAIKSGKVRYLQQQLCMFGHKQLPAWASCVSSELARILTHKGINVVGVLIDDFLFHGSADEGAEDRA